MVLFPQSGSFSGQCARSIPSSVLKLSWQLRRRQKHLPQPPPASLPLSPQAPNRTSGIFKVTPVSPTMCQFLGVSEASRTDAVKKIWDYIKLNSLQNPANKREIRCDEKLKTIFDGKETVGFLEIGKLLSPHFVKTN
ncbi:upstream activation factor subunit UAF30-like [Macadamia integrifolia]|uniref:upstream activation factor subunit UAF30-like n=1 Tax=Macadamia integrifolia TaxID=60698 RepID=UPI001C52D9BE|nr:upstream activation factor subunit UAF30-like [Macadamia integrifolia]